MSRQSLVLLPWAAATLLGLWGLFQAVQWLGAGRLHANDFKHLWAGAWLLARGESPYDPAWLFRVAENYGLGGINPFVYLPTTGLMLRPLAAMPFVEAKIAWFGLNFALLWAAVFAGPFLLGTPRPGRAALAGAVFAALAMPAMRQMSAGQMNVINVALFLLAAWGLRTRRLPAAGAGLGLATAWKIAPALPALLLPAYGRLRAGLWAGGVFAAMLLASLVAYGPGVHREAFGIIMQMGYGASTWAEFGMDFHRAPFNQSINSLMHHLFTVNPHTTPWVDLGPSLANALTLACSLLLMAAWGVAAWRGRAAARREPLPLFLASILLMLLVPSLMWDHYAVQALPPLMWLFGRPATLASPLRAVAALAILAALTVPVLHPAPAYREGLGILWMSARLWPTLALFGWITWIAANARPEESNTP